MCHPQQTPSTWVVCGTRQGNGKCEVGHTLIIILFISQISRSEVDQPETENFRAEDLHDYPPRIVCRFFPDENAPKKTICTISLSGLLPQAKFHLELKAPTPKGVVDTTKLQVYTRIYICIQCIQPLMYTKRLTPECCTK